VPPEHEVVEALAGLDPRRRLSTSVGRSIVRLRARAALCCRCSPARRR
jgi:hypothetical protein